MLWFFFLLFCNANFKHNEKCDILYRESPLIMMWVFSWHVILVIGILQKDVDQNNIHVTLPVPTWTLYIGGIHTFIIKVFESKQWSQCTKFKIDHCKLKFKNFKLLMQYFFKLSILYCKRHASNSSYNDRQYILKIQPKILI